MQVCFLTPHWASQSTDSASDACAATACCEPQGHAAGRRTRGGGRSLCRADPTCCGGCAACSPSAFLRPLAAAGRQRSQACCGAGPGCRTARRLAAPGGRPSSPRVGGEPVPYLGPAVPRGMLATCALLHPRSSTRCSAGRAARLPLRLQAALAVATHPERHSLLLPPSPRPFVVPGARFREQYYWDTLWALRGMLACGLAELAQARPRALPALPSPGTPACRSTAALPRRQS